MLFSIGSLHIERTLTNGAVSGESAGEHSASPVDVVSRRTRILAGVKAGWMAFIWVNLEL